MGADGIDEPPPRGAREELLTTQQIADWLGWRTGSVPKAMHRANIDLVHGYPASKVRQWMAQRPGKGHHAGPDRPKPGEEPPKARGACSVCGRDVAANARGAAYKHKPTKGVTSQGTGLCRGSWEPVRSSWDADRQD